MAQMNLNQNLIGPAVKILMGIEKLKKQTSHGVNYCFTTKTNERY